MKVPPAFAIAADRAKAALSFHEFVKMAFGIIEPGEKYVDGWHVGEVCKHLEAVWKGECRKLCICIPPGHMKSLIVSVLFPVWCWIRDPSLRFAVIGYDAELTGGRDGGKAAALVQSPWFKARWGDRVMIPTDPAMTNIKTQLGGFRFASSIKGKFTGRHVHFLIVDDPVKPQDISKTTLEEVKTWRTRTAPTRLLPVKDGEPGGQIYIMQRLHEDDAVGLAEKEGEWTILRLPAEFSVAEACVTPWGGDDRRDDGDLLWPERFTAKHVANLKKALGSRNSAAQLQQRPTPEGGAVFRRETFKFYKVAPAKFDQVVISIDATFKGADTSDFVAMGVWGRKGGEFFLLDMVWQRMSFTATIAAIRALCRKWPRARAKLIEDKANGPAIIDTLGKEISGIVAVNPEGGKEARANAVEPYFEAGNVYFPDPEGAVTQPEKGGQPVRYEWVDNLMNELTGFPFAAHDDGVDQLSQALIYFRAKSSRFVEAMQKLKGSNHVA